MRRALAHVKGRRAFSSHALTGLPTPLLSRHLKLQGQLVDYAGYQLPILYTGKGVLKEHLTTRSAAGVFDVSHMGQVRIHGRDRVKFMEKVVCADIQVLKVGEACLTVLCNDRGGIIDDAIVQNAGDYLFLVVNGACKHKDVAHIRSVLSSSGGGDRVSIEELPTASLIAIQGPRAAQVVQTLVREDLSSMAFMTGADMDVAGMPCRVTRCGYTGEDGFEIASLTQGPEVFDALLASGVAEPAGLGARDSLRLEAGLCLYGNELSEDVLPVEAGLGWLVSKRRRAAKGFIGADAVVAQLAKDAVPTKRRVGLVIKGAPARGGALVFDNKDAEVGAVTSGTFSPMLKQPIAMAYVPAALAKIGTELAVDVRGKKQPAVVTKMPFVPARYYKLA